MTDSAESNRLTLVKPNNLGHHLENLAKQTLLNPLTKSTHPRGQPLVKDTVKPRLNTNVGECLPELLPRSPKFTQTLQDLP
jgi:hypothetical protein